MEIDLAYEELELKACDGSSLFARHWRPSEAKAAVCLIHGMGEHSGRYQHVARKLAGAGYAVLSYDQRGHGLSPGKRGDAPSLAEMAGDTAALIELAGDYHSGLPRFLYGHSMGGNVAFSCVLRLQPDIDGLILTSPWLRLAFDPPPVKVWVGKGLARLWPSLSLSTGLKDADLFHEADEKLEPDPLGHNRISARFYFALQKEGEWLLANYDRLHTPLLLMHGTGDNITSFMASRQLASGLGERCTFIPWREGYHELHNDRDQEQVLEHIIGWLDGIERKTAL
ncbi:lysophospholipase [Paenibacillus tarimensis]